MLRYLGRRLGWAAILLLVLTLVTFVLSHVIPGDPATFMAGFGATKESIVAMRTEMGLDKPLPTGGRVAITAATPNTITGIYTIDSILTGNLELLGSAVVHLILPVATIVLAMLAVGLRATRASVMQELDRPYVRTARAKGVSEWRLYSVHLLRNALNPVISIMGLQAGYLLGWIILVETVFGWPGIGLYAYQSIQHLD